MYRLRGVRRRLRAGPLRRRRLHLRRRRDDERHRPLGRQRLVRPHHRSGTGMSGANPWSPPSSRSTTAPDPCSTRAGLCRRRGHRLHQHRGLAVCRPCTHRPHQPLASTTHTPGVWSAANVVGGAVERRHGQRRLRPRRLLGPVRHQPRHRARHHRRRASDRRPALHGSGALADGADHWFHLRTCDGAGNCSSGVHLGPFLVDTTPPSGPFGLTSTSHTPGEPRRTRAWTWPGPGHRRRQRARRLRLGGRRGGRLALRPGPGPRGGGDLAHHPGPRRRRSGTPTCARPTTSATGETWSPRAPSWSSLCSPTASSRGKPRSGRWRCHRGRGWRRRSGASAQSSSSSRSASSMSSEAHWRASSARLASISSSDSASSWSSSTLSSSPR